MADARSPSPLPSPPASLPVPTPVSAPAAAPRGAARLRGVVLYGLGLALLLAAFWGIAREQGTLASAWRSARDAPAWMVGALLALPMLSWILTSTLFWVLTRHFGVVGRREMGALIGAAWLMNYLPMRPGMVGRVAYHKAVNGIAARDSVLVVIIAMSVTALAALALAGASALSDAGAWVLLVPVAAGAAGAFMIGRAGARWRLASRGAWGFVIRYIDLATWAARYWLAFSIIGSPMSFSHAALVAAVAQVAMVVPVALGVREWVVGVFSSVTAIGLAADVLNRAAEVIGAIPTGLVSLAWLARKSRRTGGPVGERSPAQPLP